MRKLLKKYEMVSNTYTIASLVFKLYLISMQYLQQNLSIFMALSKSKNVRFDQNVTKLPSGQKQKYSWGKLLKNSYRHVQLMDVKLQHSRRASCNCCKLVTVDTNRNYDIAMCNILPSELVKKHLLSCIYKNIIYYKE